MRHNLFKIEVMYDEMEQEIGMELSTTNIFNNMINETEVQDDYEKFLNDTEDKIRELFDKIENKLALEGVK